VAKKEVKSYLKQPVVKGSRDEVTHTHTHIHTRTNTIHTQHTHAHARIPVHVRACARAHTHNQDIHNTHAHKHIHTRTQYTHIHTHTHTTQVHDISGRRILLFGRGPGGGPCRCVHASFLTYGDTYSSTCTCADTYVHGEAIFCGKCQAEALAGKRLSIFAKKL